MPLFLKKFTETCLNGLEFLISSRQQASPQLQHGTSFSSQVLFPGSLSCLRFELQWQLGGSLNLLLPGCISSVPLHPQTWTYVQRWLLQTRVAEQLLKVREKSPVTEYCPCRNISQPSVKTPFSAFVFTWLNLQCLHGELPYTQGNLISKGDILKFLSFGGVKIR